MATAHVVRLTRSSPKRRSLRWKWRSSVKSKLSDVAFRWVLTWLQDGKAGSLIGECGQNWQDCFKDNYSGHSEADFSSRADPSSSSRNLMEMCIMYMPPVFTILMIS